MSAIGHRKRASRLNRKSLLEFGVALPPSPRKAIALGKVRSDCGSPSRAGNLLRAPRRFRRARNRNPDPNPRGHQCRRTDRRGRRSPRHRRDSGRPWRALGAQGARWTPVATGPPDFDPSLRVRIPAGSVHQIMSSVIDSGEAAVLTANRRRQKLMHREAGQGRRPLGFGLRRRGQRASGN